MNQTVAIIGTRKPTEDQIAKAEMLAAELSARGYIIKTGGAYGIDHAAMRKTVPGFLEVYLPWETYNAEIIPEHAKRIVFNPAIHKEWLHSVTTYHPAPQLLTSGMRALHARNYGIVEGCGVVIALPEKMEKGGSGQGVRIARALRIPVMQQEANVGLFDSSQGAILQLALDTLRRQRWPILRTTNYIN